MKKKTKNSKIMKYIIIFIIILIFIIGGVLVYKNIFASTNNTRLEDTENYKLKNKEIDSAKDVLNEIEKVESIDIYANVKIIKIIVKLTEDVDFEIVKEISNKALQSFSEENLNYYDVEIFVSSANEESEIYPQIGYKFKTEEKFAW